ncbi:MAG: A24 family peptidase C-terminal domain-containing protein [Candidatus Bathyarchaeia archaeon]
MYEWLEYARIGLSISFLSLSSIYDLKTREVPNWIWVLFAPLGFTLTLLQFSFFGENLFLVLWALSFMVTTGLSLLLFHLGFFGGADAKALICLSIAMPVYPYSMKSYLNIQSPFFPISVFSNAVLASSLLILGIASHNLLRVIQNRKGLFEGLEKESYWKKVVVFFTGYKVDIDRLGKGSHHIPLEHFSKDENGKTARRLKISARLQDEESEQKDSLGEFCELRNRKIWATPGLPFLVFITAGFISALILGDVITWLVIKAVAR